MWFRECLDTELLEEDKPYLLLDILFLLIIIVSNRILYNYLFKFMEE